MPFNRVYDSTQEKLRITGFNDCLRPDILPDKTDSNSIQSYKFNLLEFTASQIFRHFLVVNNLHNLTHFMFLICSNFIKFLIRLFVL